MKSLQSNQLANRRRLRSPCHATSNDTTSDVNENVDPNVCVSVKRQCIKPTVNVPSKAEQSPDWLPIESSTPSKKHIIALSPFQTSDGAFDYIEAPDSPLTPNQFYNLQDGSTEAVGHWINDLNRLWSSPPAGSPPAPTDDSTEEFLPTWDFDEDNFDLDVCGEGQVVLCQPIGLTSEAELDSEIHTSKPFILPIANEPLTPAQLQAVQDAIYDHIQAKVFATKNPKKYLRFLSQLKKAIYRMERDGKIYLFSGKCPVPHQWRGDYSLYNLPPDFDYTINHSTHVFWHIIAGLQKDCVFPFNIRDICEPCPETGLKFGFCKNCSNDEAILLVSFLNDIGRLGRWIGAKVFLCNIGGRALRKVYKGYNWRS
jgi:hypothetical protein